MEQMYLFEAKTLLIYYNKESGWNIVMNLSKKSSRTVSMKTAFKSNGEDIQHKASLVYKIHLHILIN